MDDARADLLRSLLDHPAWEALAAEVEDAEQKEFERMTKLLRSSARGTAPSQPDLDWERGFWAGARRVLSWPAKAQSKISKLNEGEESNA